MENVNAYDNSLKTLRRFLFEEMINLREGKTTTSDAIAMSKLGSQVISSFKVEIEAVRVANDLKDKNIAYAENLKAIK